jgi:uncharacterized repeat protein (TIGR01451 family)
MSDENVIAGTGKSKKRLVLGLAAVMSLSSLGAGAYVWAKRDSGTSAEAEPKVTSPDQFAEANPIRPIPMGDRADLSALSPAADPYGSPRATPGDIGDAAARNPQSSAVRFAGPSSAGAVVQTANHEPAFDRNSSFPPATPSFAAPAQVADPASQAAEAPLMGSPRNVPPARLNNGFRRAAEVAVAGTAVDSGSPAATDAPATPIEPAGLVQPPATLEVPPADSTSRITAEPASADGTSGNLALLSRPQPSALPGSRPSAASPATELKGDGQPGATQLEGAQSPSLTVEKSAPSEIQVGRPATFQLKIRNVGRVAAHEVVVLDRIPKGTQLVTAAPQFTQTNDGQLMWQVGTIQPGEETLVTTQVLPLAEGEIGSVAQVMFQAQASARSVCTKPALTLSHTGPQKVLIGDPVVFDISVSNSGTGAATGVVMEENVPEGLSHEAGRELEFEIGTLAPGQTKNLRLTLKAAKAGLVENLLLVRGEGNLVVKDTLNVEVLAPALQIGLSGPKLRYLEREATYEVAIANPGTAPAKEIEVVTYLPKGMKFVSADHQGQYEPKNHAVYWSLAELPANQSGTAKVTLLPFQTGEQKLSVEGRAELGLKQACEKTVQVEGSAELQFAVADSANPIEVGNETTYTVHLTNRGSSAATNVRLSVVLPPQMKPVSGDGPTRVVLQGAQVAIDPLARVAPGEQATYKLKVQGLDAGAHRIQFQLVTDETSVPVTREEVTKVYQDR